MNRTKQASLPRNGRLDADWPSSAERILVLAPTGNDGRLTSEFLARAGFMAKICGDVQELYGAVKQGCAAILLAEEVLADRFIQVVAEALAQEPPWSDVPVIIITSGGEASQMRLRRWGIFGSGGKVTLLERPFRPGTLISTMEAALRARRRQYQVRDLMTELYKRDERIHRLAAIVETSDDAIISKDLQSRITSWNHSAEQLFGYKAEEVIGKKVTILMPPERLNEEPAILDRICRGQRIEHYQTVRKRKDGSLMDVSLTVSPLKDAHGTIIGASKILRDITQQKQFERELAEAHLKTLAASRAKDSFLAALSHELRTPLNPVLMLASESAENPQLPADVRSQFAKIRNNVELEARLIDDLLDLTRITYGKLVLNKEMVDMPELLADAVAIVQSDLTHKRIALALKLTPKKIAINGDAVRLQQVLWNLLKNAVKFTPEGGAITVRTGVNEVTGEFVVSVTDTGIGMTSDGMKHIFEAFAQGEQGAEKGAHQFGGLGLGLAISRSIVELHGGKISAQSGGRGRGSKFTLRLPLFKTAKTGPAAATRAKHASRPSPKNPAKPGIRVLLVEDHEPTRDAISYLLARRDYLVTAAGSVADARKFAAGEHFDLLISDIGLPDGNGNDLMAELRKGSDIKGIALTGYGMDEDVSRSLAAGFAAHLVKPIRIQALESALAAARL